MADREPREDTALRGIGLAALGYGVIAFGDAAAKWALPETGVAMAMVWRGLLGAVTVAVLARGRGLRPVNTRLLVMRCALHCCVTVIYYVAWVAMPLADTYAVAASVPLLMTLFAIPLLGERPGWRRWCGTLVGFLGVLVMLRPGGDLWRWQTPMLLGGMAMLAVSRIWTRVLARTDTPAAVAFWLMAAHVPVGLLILPWFPGARVVPSAGVVPVLLFLGFANGSAHFLFARAFALAPVATIAPYEYTPLLWGVLLGFLVWGDVPAWVTLAGAAVVIAAGLYTLHRERVRQRAALILARGAPA